ncbi:hypothetical protein Tco_0741803 [Tanacetum coccineum]
MSTGVPYTDDEIMAIVRRSKQRGYIPGVGRVLERQGMDSQPEVGSDSGSGGAGDDEPGDDEDADEDEEDDDS